MAEWREQNKELRTKSKAAWGRAHRDHRRSYDKRKYDEDSSVPLAANQRRRARKAGAPGTPPSAQAWRDVLAFYRGVCAYCGDTATDMDHVRPLARGGAHDISNVVPACGSCNSRKGTQTWTPQERHPQLEAQDHAQAQD